MTDIVTGIGKQKRNDSFLPKLARQAIAPPFFLVGVIAGFTGTAYQGVHLWMQLHGQMTLGASFVSMRQTHAAFQLLLFFGAFVSGFLLQAMPKLVETSKLRPVGAIFLLPIFVAGALLVFISPFGSLGYWLIAFHFGAITLLALQFGAIAPRHALYRSGLPIAWATAWLSVGALLDLSYPVTGLLVFWGAYIPLIEVTVRRVFFGLIGIQVEKNVTSPLVASLYFGATVSGVFFLVFATALWWWLFIILTCLTIITYIAPRFNRSAFRLEPFPIAYWGGMLWLVLGALLLFQGPENADGTLHTWAIGLAFPLVLVVAPQVVRGHTGIQVFNKRLHLLLLLLWQLIPLSRGFGRILSLPGWTSSVFGALTGIVLLIWSVAMCTALLRGWLRGKTLKTMTAITKSTES